MYQAKETLQLRHQLSASGLSLRAAAYDTRRHQVLTFDSHPLRPHVLRLFSLRRELKSVPLFDKTDDERTTKRHKAAKKATSTSTSTSAARKRSSFFEAQLQQLHEEHEKRLEQPKEELVVPRVLLQYSPTLDVFVCVYSRAKRPKGASKVPKATTQGLALFEPATLRRLLVYRGPETHSLQCAHFDPSTDKLVLASHLQSDTRGHEATGAMLPSAPKNVVEILQLSKRPDDRHATWPAGLTQDRNERPTTLLFVENTRTSLRHPDTLALICASRGLRELYGAVSDCGSASTDTCSALLEWRQSQPGGGKFVLARRVMLRARITAMTLSPCGDWLLVGFCTGGMRVWNVNGSRTNGSALFTIDADPYEPTGPGVAEAQAEVLSSIEITTTPTSELTGSAEAATPTDVIVIAAERDTGVVRHWMFSVERKMFEDNSDGTNSGEHRYPRLSLVGKFNAGGKEQIGKDESPSKFKNQDSLGPPLKTLVMCVTVDMGSCFENLLLVVWEDVIHVLKVQTVLYVMQEFASIEEVYSVRAITEQGESQVISLSSTAACKLRIFPLDDSSNPASRSTKQLFITPHTSDVSPHVCSIETVTNARKQISFVVIAWSSGVVDVYDLEHEQHVLKLQDNYLTDRISALSIVAFQRVIAEKSKLPEADPTGYLSSRSYEDIYQTLNSELADAGTSDEAAEQAPKTLIVVGTETGKLYGWMADTLCGGDLSFKSIQKANVRAQAAHSSHIIQIARMDAAARGGRVVLASVAADGIIKLWSVPSLKLIGYVSSAAEGCPSTASCIEIMRGHSRVNGAGNQSSVNVYVIAGYEDGRLATWCVDTKRVSFQRLEVSTHHERRVTKICHIASDVVSTGLAEFLSCSLDMTIIQWQILGSGSVQEKRYFDIGTAIVDMVLVKEQAILALAHEVCKFSFAPSSKCDMKYLIRPELIANSPDADNDSNEADSTSVNDDEYPNTPTTRSVEDPTDVAIQPRQTSRSVDEYLTLHVPSAVLHLEAASSSAVTTTTATDSAPATRLSEQDERTFKWNEMMPRHIRESKSADKFQRRWIGDDVLREYLQDYIARHGSGGTMTANRITHLLALRPELPNVKRPGFALAKSLKDLKLTAQTRVDSEEALQIMRLLLTISTTSRPSFDAPTMTRSLKQKDPSNEKVCAQRTREKKQARRKHVVTYNLLGEKYVRWEDVPEDEYVSQNQSPPSPTNSLIVHTPPSPHLRDQSGFEGDPLSAEVGFVEPPPLELPSSTAVNDAEVLEDSNEIAETPTTDSTETVPTSSPLINSSRPHASEESSEEEDEEEEGEEDSGDNDNEEDSDDGEKDITPKDQNQVTLERTLPSKAARTTTSATKQRRSKRAQRYNHSVENIFESPLVNGIRLSPMFQQFWTKGYCWCQPAPRLRINWTDPVKAKNDGGGSQKRTKGTGRRSSPKCKICHKRLHTVELPRVGYAPHFSRQATFDIIVEVYSKLTATAHTRLYQSSSPRKESSLECSIFGALFDVFLATYGMRSAVEMKLKLFFVSMCHYLREYDAVAVFGELLGLHTPEHADEYDQAPSTLVALCVCCYSWLYSRGMIVNGDSFSGRQRGYEWGNTCGAMTTDVTPATDGTTHWQFVRIEHALLCAQDNLLYPLVSPGFLRNIMLFMQEYAQGAPTRLLRTDSPDFSDEATRYYRGPARWIELHRFLRLLVGEWKQQNAQFRVVERLLFVHPQRDAALEGDLLEKLRLMLSCFVFYDHERVGAMATSDFETLLFKLRYLWSEEGVVEQVAPSKNKLFENAIVAIRKRFIDLNHDGQLCYLDFWAMLYIVGVKTRGLIHFHEIPSFCRDYRLEILPELSDMVRNYMELSCTLLLPKGLQVGKSSIDQKAERQHRRRVGGLHDGIFHISKTLKGSLSTQELLSSDETKKLGLFLDGAAPATRQTASTTALDRFRPVSVEAEFRATSGYSSSRREPVVVGVRPIGPTPKPVAPLRVSVMGGSDLLSGTNSRDSWVQNGISPQTNAWSRDKATQRGAYTNMYIQFPQVSPVCRCVGANEIRTFPATQILGSMPMEEESEEEAESIDYDVSPTQEEPEKMPLGEPPPLDRIHSSRSVVPEEDVASEEPAVEESLLPTPKPILEKRRSATAVVVVPTVETEKSVSRTSSRHELLKRPSSRSLQRAVSERIKLEEAAIQLEAEKLSSPPPRQPSPTSPIPTTRKTTSPDSESDADQIVIPRAEPEVTADIIEASIEKFLEVVEPDEPTPMPVEEVRPEPEPVAQIRIEVVEPAIVQPVVEQAIVAEPLVVDPVVEPTVVLPEPVREVTVIEPVEPVVLDEVTPTPAPPEEVAPTIAPEPYPDAESDAASEELPDITAEAEYKPQVIRTEEIQIHRAFRFSQQPTFLHSIAVTNNPYRTAMWNPNDDSESDEEDAQKGSVKKYAASNRGGFDADDPIYSSDDESVTSRRTGTMLNGAKAHKQSGEGETQSSATSPNSISAHSKDAAMPLKPQPSYSQLSRLDSGLHPTLRHRKEKKLNELDYSYSDDLESIQDEVEDEQEIVTSDPLKPIKRKRLDEDAERALYGERLVSALGEGIAFTPEAEAAMQQKWQQFFTDSESKMFSAMRNELEKKQMEQREAEERQKRLRKKWQEQRDQDLQRLQNSRHNSILMSSANTNSANSAVDASFRLRRIRRESCRQLTEELEFGVSVQRDLKETKDMEFFHFFYLPEGHGSIITLKMHALRGDAEVFMSTDTKVPCSSDFMWRSYERMAKTAGEGHRIILYPHDLLRVVTSATANAAPTEHAAAIVESNASTASLRSFYPKQPDATYLKVGFYLSVVALEPGTTFTLAVMSSGQKMQPSRAIQTVDYLIDRFNMLSRSFQGQSVVPFVTSSSVRAMSASGSAGSEINDQRILSVGNDSGTTEEEGGDDEENGNENEPTEAATKRRTSKKSADERVDQKELKSFQHLLETLSEKKGFGSPRAASILLAGPSEEHLEFVQDEGQRLQEMHQILSPPKPCPEGSLGHRGSIAVVTERRLTMQGKRQKLRRVVAARLQKKLAPLRHKSIAGGELEKSASTGGLANLRVAKTAPRPVAYSITSLDPLPRSQRFKATSTPLAQVRRSTVIDKGSTGGAELEQKE